MDNSTPATHLAPAPDVKLTIDQHEVVVPAGTTIFDAARMSGIPIPTLCHQQNETPVGVCRVCVVDIGQRVYAASCIRQVEPGMVVKTSTEGVTGVRRTLVELLMADHPTPCHRQQLTHDCELERLASRGGSCRFALSRPSYAPRTRRIVRLDRRRSRRLHPLRAVHARVCSEIRHNFVLARRGKGYQAGIAFDENLPMSSSTCVSCGECMVSCPTGALTNKKVIATVLTGEAVPIGELKELDIFHNVSGTFLSLNSNAVRRRHFKAGEIICREGDYGSTAFYIEDGTC